MNTQAEGSACADTRTRGAHAGTCSTEVPASSGTSFKPEHAANICEDPGSAAWFEVHPENYMVAGGPRLAQLEALRADYPLSLHGVGLSLGGGDPPDEAHLAALHALVARFEPGLVSEHLAWSSHDGLYLADLLPAALTTATLTSVTNAIDRTQSALGRQILIENPSSYVPRPHTWLPETQFLTEVAQRSGCALLVDVNNIYVSAHNLGFDARDYVDALAGAPVGEIHLAGHSLDPNDGDPILIDTHGAAVADEVWALYRRLIRLIGPTPTLIEWDTDLPAWPTLRGEADRASEHMRQATAVERVAS